MYKHYPYDNDDSLNVASSGDCTGLIPITPETFDSMESYSDIYDIPLPKVCNDRRKTMNNNQNSNKYSDEYSTNRKDTNKKEQGQNSNKKDSNQNTNKR